MASAGMARATHLHNIDKILHLDRIRPTWSLILPVGLRFKLAMDGDAVLDIETGLVWEQSPDPTSKSWANAMNDCNQKTVGNRKGWRLPIIQELATLVDPTQNNPALPSGHPFSNVESFLYWSASTVAAPEGDTSIAWVVDFSDGDVIGGEGKLASIFAWCVRGGQSPIDPQ